MENQIQFYVQWGSMTISCTVITLLSSIKISYIDYTMLSTTLVCCLTTWSIFKLKQEEKPGFVEIDIKQLQDSIAFVFMLDFFMASTNWCLDFFLTTPIALIATWKETTSAYSLENGNMDCFTKPELVASNLN